MIRKETNEPLWKNIVFFALYTFIPLSTFLTSLFAFWPGLFSDDSSYQWEMAKGHTQINAVHPVAHTVLIRELLKIWDNPAVISMFGVLFLSLAFGYCLFVLDLKGVNRFLLIGAAVIFAISPNNLVLSITMWKDIPYAASILASTGTLLYIATSVKSNGTIIKKSVLLNLYLASIFLNLCWAFRFNGALVTIGGLLLILVYMRKEKILTRILPVLLSGLIVGIFTNYILPPMVNSLPNTYDYATKYMIRQVIGADLQSNALSEEDSATLWGIFNKEKISENFIPEDFSAVLWDDDTWAKFEENQDATIEIRHIYFKTLIHKPGIMLQNAIQSSNLVWGITKPDKLQSADFAKVISDYNPMGIHRKENTMYAIFPVLAAYFLYEIYKGVS